MSSLLRWLHCYEGTGRCLALIRMGLVANAWARFSNEHVLYRNLDPEVFWVSLLFFVSSSLTFAGLWTRVSAWGFALSVSHFVYVAGHLDGYEPYTHHHTTLLALSSVLLALSPSGASLSVDRYLVVRRAEASGRVPPPERVNLWAQRLMALLVAAVYFWGAVDKTNLGFLSGARMTHYLMRYYTGPSPLEDLAPGLAWMMRPAAVATVLLEYALAVGLFFRTGRRWLFTFGLLLHGVFYVALSVFTFTTTMCVLYLAFVEDDELNAVLRRLLSGSAKHHPSSRGICLGGQSSSAEQRVSRSSSPERRDDFELGGQVAPDDGPDTIR